jgi:hypothetical protein
MAGSAVSDDLVVQSHVGPYTVTFSDDGFAQLNEAPPDGAHLIVDERVAQLYADELSNVLALPAT